MLRIIQRTPDPLAVTGMDRQTVGVMQRRTVVQGWRRLARPEQVHAGQRCHAQFADFVAQEHFGLNVHGGVAARINHKTVSPGSTR
ncbi:hypothetical protein D3C71_1994800 [compost metagenome]